MASKDRGFAASDQRQCSRCGSIIDGIDAPCPICGALPDGDLRIAVDTIPDKNADSSIHELHHEAFMRQRSRRAIPGIALALIGIVLLSALGITLFLSFFNDAQSDTASDVPAIVESSSGAAS